MTTQPERRMPATRLFATVLTLAIPISAQQVLSSSFQLVDVAMVNQLGDVAVGATALSNRIFMVLALVLGAIGSGVSIYAVQATAQKDDATVRAALGAGLTLALALVLPVTLVAVAAPRFVMSLSPDPAVVETGASFLRVTALTYPFAAVTMVVAGASRAAGRVKLPLVASFVGIALNTVLNYGLIFGHLGLPRWGVVGAAVATSIAKVVELAVLVVGLHVARSPAAPTSRALLRIPRALLRRVADTVWPLIVSELFWALGLFTYFVIYARMGTAPLAIMGKLAPIEYICIDVFVGVGTAAAIVIGRELGHGRMGTARDHAVRILLGAPVVAAVIGVGVFAARDAILAAIHVSASREARLLLLIIAAALALRVFNMVAVVGVLRSGGDTRFLLVSNVAPMWLVGIPLACIAGLVLQLPIYLVYVTALSEDLVKAVVFGRRIASGRWRRTLVGAGIPPPPT